MTAQSITETGVVPPTTTRAPRRINYMLLAGGFIMGSIILFGLLGPFLYDMERARVGAVLPSQSPSAEYPLGTDVQGSDILALLILGTPQTLKIGLIAGIVGLTIGIVLGLISGYFGGFQDTVVRIVTDIFLTIPALAILIVVASSIRVLSIEAMALIVASLSWMGPTRTIRSQVLTLRERRYIQMARISGIRDMEIIFTEVMPNLIPYLAATLVLSISSGILAAIGLEVLGLGPSHLPSLGMMIFWAQYYDAIFRGMWWWFVPPIVTLVLIFVGLFLLATGLDNVSNPRLQKG
ncbi:MAG: ABC transporter permease [Litorilinea sp.]